MRNYWKHLVHIGYAGIMLSCLFGCFCLFGCSSDDEMETIDDVLNIDDPDAFVASANTKFGFNLLTALREKEPTTNIFISPLSISIALTMTYNGAVGETERAMAEVLGIAGVDRDAVNQANLGLRESLGNRGPKVQISVANSIWARQGVAFNPDFLERNRQFFSADVAALDFSSSQAVERINGWVDTNTNGKIKKIVQTIDPQTLFLLINAIYFKGSWKDVFDKSRTREDIFYLSDGREKQVPMMERKGVYPYFQGENFEAAILPYGDGDVSMYVFLPDQKSNLDEFLGSLNMENWASWLPQFQELKNKRSMMILPRFKLEYEVTLNDTLKALGMEIAFNSGADFSGMGPGLFISWVRHKTFVEVNEAGTEAAAVTVVGGPEEEHPIFRVDRPFFFAIYDNTTKTILFMGVVREPM